MKKLYMTSLMLLIASVGMVSFAHAGDVTVGTGVDFYNRYVWRGLDIAATPSLQPTLAVDYKGLEIGTWAAYTLSNQASEADEIDFWLSYGFDLKDGAGLSLILTDYYFPNAGVPFSNFNNWDAVDNEDNPDPGAHTLEAGVSLTGPESFPVTFSAYMNVHNDAGDNTYFQLDYPFMVDDVEMGVFVGMAGGSQDNPGYYGCSKAKLINLGVSAAREIEFSDSFTLPLNISFVINPNDDISHLLVGISL